MYATRTVRILQVSNMYFHEDLVPQHFIADHAPAMQSTSIEEWGDVADEHQLFLQCYILT